MKRTRLRSASLVGWHGQFPVELWSIIIRFLPLTPYGTLDLAMVLRLLSVCKGMLDALMTPILCYLRDTMSYSEKWRAIITAGDEKPNIACMTWSVLDDVQKKSRGDLLTRYIGFCLLDRRYQTLEHLVNCLSLLHYAYLEGTYCREIAYREGRNCLLPVKVHSPNLYSSLRKMYYFQSTTKKAVALNRMAELSSYDFVEINALRERARLCLIKKGMNNENIRLVILDGLARVRQPEVQAFFFDLIEESEENIEASERTFKIRKARTTDSFSNLLVTRDNKRRHILSSECKDFLANCFFMPNATCYNATYFFLLSKLREANEKIINESQRYYIPSHITLTK